MANTFIKSERIVAMGLGMLQRQLVLPRLVTRLGLSDFEGSSNDTVNIRVPAILTAREQPWRDHSSPITFDSVEELTFPVRLTKQPYSAVKVTDEELTLDIASFGSQVLDPQIRAVAEKLEGYIATEMDNGTYGEEIEMTGGADEAKNVAIEARRILNVANVPTAGRVLVLGANVEADFLKLDHLTKVAEAGTDSALRDAVVGRIMGFTVIGNVNSIDADTAYAFHPSAFAFACIAPVVPVGATAGASAAYEGLAMRWIRDYDANYLVDRSVVSAFAGTASIEDERTDSGEFTNKNVRCVKINFTAGS